MGIDEKKGRHIAQTTQTNGINFSQNAVRMNNNEFPLFSDLKRMESRRVTRQLTKEASQEEESSTATLENLLDRIDPTNFVEKFKTEADAILFATTVGLLPERGYDEDIVCDCSEIFGTKTSKRAPLGWKWVCKCGKEMSPLAGTIFYKSHLSIRQVLKLILCLLLDTLAR